MDKQTTVRGPVKFVLEDEAKQAISQIAHLLGGNISDEEVVQRALGTELFLLEQVRKQNAKVFIESREGRRELDLLGR